VDRKLFEDIGRVVLIELAEEVGQGLVPEQRREGPDLGSIQALEELGGIFIEQLAGERPRKQAVLLVYRLAQAVEVCLRGCRRLLQCPIHEVSAGLGASRAGRLPQHFDNAANGTTSRCLLARGWLSLLLLDDHEVMRGLRADSHGHAAHNRAIIALRDVVADTIGHGPPPFWTENSEVPSSARPPECCQAMG
jgi:hypothetical protein